MKKQRVNQFTFPERLQHHVFGSFDLFQYSVTSHGIISQSQITQAFGVRVDVIVLNPSLNSVRVLSMSA